MLGSAPESVRNITTVWLLQCPFTRRVITAVARNAPSLVFALCALESLLTNATVAHMSMRSATVDTGATTHGPLEPPGVGSSVKRYKRHFPRLPRPILGSVISTTFFGRNVVNWAKGLHASWRRMDMLCNSRYRNICATSNTLLLLSVRKQPLAFHWTLRGRRELLPHAFELFVLLVLLL